MKRLMAAMMMAAAVTAWAEPAAVEDKVLPGDPLHAVCQPGKIWTVHLQCDVGTRSGGQRIFGGLLSAPGVEACAVVYQGCQPSRLWSSSGRRGREATDSLYDPLALVIFGVRDLVDAPGF